MNISNILENSYDAVVDFLEVDNENETATAVIRRIEETFEYTCKVIVSLKDFLPIYHEVIDTWYVKPILSQKTINSSILNGQPILIESISPINFSEKKSANTVTNSSKRKVIKYSLASA